MKRNNLQGQVVALETEKLHLENEIERLNNIINELEKDFEEELKNINYNEDKIYAQGIHDTIISHKYKLQELKGSDKIE